jgi:glyoxylase-like metal-dependent hydrolase (beta-lactamase superfamily II)
MASCTFDTRVGMLTLQRNWLSANNILFVDETPTVIDTGYVSHAAQTVALVEHALDGRQLCRIINTHLHSDHCGGNAALQARWPLVQTFIPPGESAAVAAWDDDALTYRATGQECPRFSFDGLLQPDSGLTLGGAVWQVLAAPGHDPHSVMLYCPANKTLISADALWENGFGIVFPELEGESAFDAVRATLDVIARLDVARVIPGHGAPFEDVAGALARAYRRLDAHVANPQKHARHAVKALVMFRMLADQRRAQSALVAHLAASKYFKLIDERWFKAGAAQVLGDAIDELVGNGQLVRQSDELMLAGGQK